MFNFSQRFALGAFVAGMVFSPVIFSAEDLTMNGDYLATEGYYFGLHAGGALPGTSTQVISPGYSVGTQIGYRDDNYRTEFALNFIQHKLKSPASGKYDLATFMLNAYYDFNFSGSVIPFLGAGVGYLRSFTEQCPKNLPICSMPVTGNKIAYQGIAGIGFGNRHVRLDLRYRYFTFLKNDNYYDNIVEAVLNYFF